MDQSNVRKIIDHDWSISYGLLLYCTLSFNLTDSKAMKNVKQNVGTRATRVVANASNKFIRGLYLMYRCAINRMDRKARRIHSSACPIT